MIQAARLQVVVGAETAGAERELRSFSSTLGQTARNWGMLGASMSLGVTAPMVAAAKSVIGMGVGFESAFTGVIKTVDATEAELAGLETGIRRMATELPASAVEIATVAAAAGQLGIQTQNIESFSRVMIDLGEATNLSAETAATELARFANITQMSQTEFDRLGSSIVAVGNNMATTEAEIVSMAMRIAGAGTQIGLSEAQIIGLAGALSSVGIEAEAGGTAISRVMVDMAQAVARGGDKLRGFARVAGVSSDVFVKSFGENAAEAMLLFIEGLGQISESGGNVFATLEELELADIRVRDALLRASGAGDLFRRSMDISNTAWEENLALTREANLRYQTTESRIAILGNRMRDLGITLFQTVAPNLDGFINGLSTLALNAGPVVSAFLEANPALVQAGLAFAGVLAAAGPLIGVLAGIAGALSLLGGAAGPIMLVVGATAALAAAWAGDFGGIRTGLQTNIIEPLQDILDKIAAVKSLDAASITIGPLTVAWTPQIKYVNINDVIQGIWTPQYAKIKIADLIDASAKWEPDYTKIKVNDLIDATVAWTPTVKYLNANDVIQGIWTPSFSKIQVSDLFVGVWTPEIKAIDVTGVIKGSYTPDVAGVQVGDVIRGVWTPKYTAIGVGDLIAGVWMPNYKTINVGDIFTGVWTPNYATIKAGDVIQGIWRPGVATIYAKDIIDGVWTPDVKALKVGDVITGMWTPEYSKIKVADLIEGTWVPGFVHIKAGDLVEGAWTPKVTMLNVADIFTGTLDLTGKVAKLSFGDLLDISGSVGADGKIKVAFTGEDFDFDLTEAISTMKGKVVGFGEEVKAAWEGEGWSGVGALAKQKITDLGTEISTGLTGLVTTVQNGLLLGSLGFWGTVRGLTTSENLDTLASNISTGINALLGGLTALSGLQWDVIGNAGTALTSLATSVISFGTSVVDGIDATKIASSLTNAFANISGAIDKALDTEKLEGLGAAAGKVVGTLVGKLTELFSAPGFGEDVGTAVGKATAALAQGALSLATGIATELGKIQWGQFTESMGDFVAGFMGSLAREIANADWSPVAHAIAMAVGGAIINLVTSPRAWIDEDRERILGAAGQDPQLGLSLPNRSRLPIWAGGSIGVNPGDTNTWFQDFVERVTDALSNWSFGGAGGGTGFSPFANVLAEIKAKPVFDPALAWEGEPFPVNSTPVFDPSKLSILEGAKPLELPVMPTVSQDALNAAVLGGDKTGSLKVPAAVEVIDLVLPPNTAPVKAPVQVIDFIVPSNVDLFASAAGIGSAISDAASQFKPEAPRFEWPELPEWKWPDLPVFRWPELPRWTWPAIPRPSWIDELQVPRPSWLGELLTWSPVVQVRSAPATVPGQLAEGTDNWRGGWTWVGERGPELVNLPRGSRVLDNETSMAAAGGIHVTIHATVANDLDLKQVAYEVAREIQWRLKGR